MQRKTRQRDAIQAAFRQEARPLSPQEVLDSAKCQVPGLGIATVYRTINGLVEDGLLSPIELPGMPTIYEAADLSHHHHFHCKKCGKVFDVEGCPGSAKLGMDIPGFVVESHEVIFYGSCNSCN